jgi:hypothetical protein
VKHFTIVKIYSQPRRRHAGAQAPRRQRWGVFGLVHAPEQVPRRSAIAPLPAGLLAPVLDEDAQSYLGQRAPPHNLPGVPGCDYVRLVRPEDAPMKAVGAAPGIPENAARLAFRVNEQFGAWAEATPPRRWTPTDSDISRWHKH